MRRGKRRELLIVRMVIFLLLLIILSVRPASAEEKVKLSEVVITAARVEEPLEDTTSDVTIITGEDIKKMDVQFIPDVLRRVPALNVTQNGGAGKQATVFLRGGNPSQTLVMIDGVKVNNVLTGEFDFSGLSVDDIERIEIVKGPQSTMYGSEAMAGVINIITKKGEGKTRVEGSFEGGSFGTYKPSAGLSGGSDKFNYRLTGSYFSTEGISAAKSGPEKDGYRNTSLSGKFGIRPSEKFELEIMGKYYHDWTALDDFDFFARQAVDNPNFTQQGLHYLLSGKAKIYLFPIWEQIVNVSTATDSFKFRDPVVAFNNADIKATVNTVEWQHNLYLTGFYTVTAGGELRREEGENTGNFNNSLDNKAVYLNNILKLFNESFILNAGMRYDDHESFGKKMTYKVGALYRIKEADLSIKGSYGTGFRAPAFNELFFPFFGNINLRPEESSAWEIGLEKGLLEKRAVLSVSYFDQRYRDLIQTDPLTFTAANIARAKVKGVEAALTSRISDGLDLRAGYTYLNTEDETSGGVLPLRPKNKLNLSASYSIGDFGLTADYIFVSKRFDSSSQRDLSPYSLVNVSGNYRATKWLTLFARIDNLFDAHYEEVGSFSTPGFSVFGGVKINTL